MTSEVATLPNTQHQSVADGPNLLQLPEDILIKVFEYLSDRELLHVVPLVCRYWCILSRNPLLIRKVILKRDVPAEHLVNILTVRSGLRVLKCINLANACSNLHEGLRLCTRLTCVDLGFCLFSKDIAINIATCLPPTLIHLNVEGIRSIEINFIRNVVRCCPRLEAFNLSHCVDICDECVQLIAENLRYLSHINLDGIIQLTDLTLLHLAGSDIVRSGRLRAIWLDGYNFTSSGLSTFLLRIAQPQHRLSLDYNHSGHFLPDFIRKCRTNLFVNMSVFWLSFGDHLNDQFVSIIPLLPKLTSLTLRKAPDVTTRAWCQMFSTTFTPICGAPNLAFQYLKHLDLSEAQTVNDNVITEICNCCGSQLRSLSLDWCYDVTDYGLEEIVFTCVELRHLSLVGNHIIEGQSLASVPTKQLRMQIINLTQCNRIIDSILEDLVRADPNICVFDYFGEKVGGDASDICHFDIRRLLEKVVICAD